MQMVSRFTNKKVSTHDLKKNPYIFCLSFYPIICRVLTHSEDFYKRKD